MTEETVAMATVCHRLLPYQTAVPHLPMSKCVTMESKELIDPCFLFHILHYLPGLQIPGVSLKSLNGGRTASESAQVSAYVHICLHNLPLSACFLVTLLRLSPQEARDFESKKCNHLKTRFCSSLCPILCAV